MAEPTTKPKEDEPKAPAPKAKDDALASTKKEASKKDGSSKEASSKDAKKDAPVKKAAKPAAETTPLALGLNVLMGFCGLTLLVGFFLPWLNDAPTEEGASIVSHSGLDLALTGDLVGTPAPLLFLVPGLGAALAVTAFMRFRWSAHVAIGIAVGLIGYSLYVLLQMFVQHTALGLWLVTGGTFVVLLLGFVTWSVTRDKGPKAPKLAAGDDEPALAGAKK